MAMNYAESWEKELLEIQTQGALTSPFLTDNVKWLNNKTVHFTAMSTSGYKNHSRSGGWNRGDVNQSDNAYTVSHDRDIEFLLDKADVDETNSTASIENVSKTFESTQSVPETDALLFSRVGALALTLDSFHSATAAAAYTADNVFTKLKSHLKHLRRYRDKGLIAYVTSDIMDLLERSKEFSRKIEMTQVAEGGTGLETRVTYIDGVPVMEVVNDERFYTAFNWGAEMGGFTPLVAYQLTKDKALVSGKTYYTKSGTTYTAVASPNVSNIATYYEYSGGYKINVLIATPLTTKSVKKIASIYAFAPGKHTEGDGWLYQNRSLSDTFTFPNGLNNTVDSVYVDIDPTELTA